MEWEVMFLCNTVGILVLILILMYTLLGIKEKKASRQYITEEYATGMW